MQPYVSARLHEHGHTFTNSDTRADQHTFSKRTRKHRQIHTTQIHTHAHIPHTHTHTGAYCDMCYPNFPKGVQVLGQTASTWAWTNFSLQNHSYRTAPLHPYYIAGAAYTIETKGNDTLSVELRANVVPPPGASIVIDGVHSRTCPAATPAACATGAHTHAERGDVACRVSVGGHSQFWAVDTVWVGSRLHLAVRPSSLPPSLPFLSPTSRDRCGGNPTFAAIAKP